jgi:anti-sigma B factor antagonist
MEITSSKLNHAIVISIRGSIDALTADQVTNYFSKRMDEGNNQFIADLTKVDFMSSAGLRAILATLKQSRQNGGDLRLAAAQPGVEKILKMSGFTSILKTYPTVGEAVADFSAV